MYKSLKELRKIYLILFQKEKGEINVSICQEKDARRGEVKEDLLRK